jgi:hypothetical protein
MVKWDQREHLQANASDNLLLIPPLEKGDARIRITKNPHSVYENRMRAPSDGRGFRRVSYPNQPFATV